MTGKVYGFSMATYSSRQFTMNDTPRTFPSGVVARYRAPSLLMSSSALSGTESFPIRMASEPSAKRTSTSPGCSTAVTTESACCVKR